MRALATASALFLIATLFAACAPPGDGAACAPSGDGAACAGDEVRTPEAPDEAFGGFDLAGADDLRDGPREGLRIDRVTPWLVPRPAAAVAPDPSTGDPGAEPVVDDPDEPIAEDPVIEDPVVDDPVEEPPVDDPADDPADEPADDVPEAVTPDDLTPLEMAKIDALRDAIFAGLDAGEELYLDTVTLSLQNLGLTDDYATQIADAWADQNMGDATCPFTKAFDDTPAPDALTCDYLADIAKVEAYSELTKTLAKMDLPDSVADAYVEEALFWMEQGTISGIEAEHVLVRSDLKAQGFCNPDATPALSAANEGYDQGRALFIDRFNGWLASNGHVPDYPVMSQQIQVCNANASMLDPARKKALDDIDDWADEHPLCADYQADTPEAVLQLNQADLDYAKSMKDGIEAEFALAAVKTFKVIPCNVSDPIVVDLDRDGLELLPVHRGVNFDLYGVGSAQATAWVQPDDGLLVLDRNGNGLADDGSELFGNLTGEHADGFAQLAELDSDGDRAITEADAAYAYTYVWQDANTDGVCTSAEMLPLADAGIARISLDTAAVDATTAGNPVAAVAYADGPQGPMLLGDAFLHTAPHASLALAR